MMKKYFWMVVAIGAIVSGRSLGIARAEGGDKNWGGAQGVNRVVRAQGKVFSTSVGANISCVLPVVVHSSGTVDVLTTFGDKPTVYIGGDAKTKSGMSSVQGSDGKIYFGSSTEVDAGLQFEITGLRGWTAFISTTDRNGDAHYVNPRYWNPDTKMSLPWRGGGVTIKDENGEDEIVPWNNGSNGIEPGEASTSCTLTLSISDGNIKLSVDGASPKLGSFYWNPDPSALFATPDNTSGPFTPIEVIKSTGSDAGITPKNVVGMTRPYPNTDQLDGSRMTCSLSNSSLGGMNINQQRTGYDAPGNGSGIHKLINVPLTAWDAVWTSGNETIKAPNAATIVEFPDGNNFNNRQGTAANPGNQGSSARYSGEQININLRRACRPMGKKVEW